MVGMVQTTTQPTAVGVTSTVPSTTGASAETARTVDEETQQSLARLVQFLRADIPGNFFGLVFLVSIYVFAGRNPYVLLLAGCVVANAGVCIWALRRAHEGQIVAPVTAICVSMWVLALVVALLAPFALPVIVVLVLYPVVLVLPYVSRERLRAFCLAASVVIIGCSALSQLQDVSHFADDYPHWVTTFTNVALVPVVFAFASLTLWHHSTRVSQALDQTRQANLALRASEQALEGKVDERTRELAVARDEALAAVEAKSAFLATMSHEIRTPLNAVIGMTHLLLDTQLSKEQKGFAQTVRTSGEALLSVISDILDFSKIEAGKLELEMLPFDLREAVEDAVDVVAPSAAAKNIELASYVDENAPDGVVGDVTRFRQILLNLLSNAVKFTDEGEVVLTVAAEATGDDRVRLNASVRDTGVGIPRDKIEELFESFTQLDTSTTRRFGGTGLGLTISRRLTELMGGRLWAESDGVSGRGSTFHLDLRLTTVDLPASRRLPGYAVALTDQRVLVVDDNATNRHLLRLQAQSWGMQVRETEHPREALDWIKRGDPFDVAILDMHMPEMDGLTLARAVRHERGGQLAILIMTSFGRLDDGADRDTFVSLTKPVKPSQLFDALVDLLAPIEAAAVSRRPVSMTRERGGELTFDPEMAVRHPLRILLAEDNALNQEMALQILGRLGYGADVATNGVEAIAAIRASGYDVVLMDIQMPEMDGREAARRICAAWPRDRRPRLVAMTANAMAGDREQCLAAGMDDYIAKPIRIPELVAALEQVRGERPRAAPTAPAVERPSRVSESLRRVVGDDDAAIVRLLDLFIGEVVPLLDQLVVHRSNNDLEAFTRGAHTLKSNAASFGASELAAHCRELEAAGKRGLIDDVDPLIVAARSELAMLVTEIETLREDRA
jgi:signal transduction histidine kinase/DNA-binding response OmpR family regulator